MVAKQSEEGSSAGEAGPIVLVGWDGAPFHLLSEFVADGELPTLAGIAESGYFGPIETVPYVMSSCAWSTFLTGKNAGKHGVFDFYSNDFEEDSYFRSPIDGSERDATELGEVLNEHDRSIGQINVPLSYPAKSIDEFVITGMLTPGKESDGFTHPGDFLDDYESIDEYQIDIGEGKGADRETFIDAVDRTVENRMELALYALERADDPDVFFVVFTSPDRLSHYYYHFVDESHPFRTNETAEDLERYGGVLDDLYRNLDDKLERIIDRVESTYDRDPLVAVVSDHGMTSLKRIFHVNKWLAEDGYLTFKDDEDELDAEITEKLDDRVEYIFGKVDWENTTAYAMGKRGAIYVNLEGREPRGSVPPEEYDSVVSSLAADLQEIVDPDVDRNIVEAVHTREELFHGEHVDKAPDLLVYLEEGYYPFGYAFELDSSNLFSTNDWPEMPFVTGIEDRPGIFGITGPGISSDTDLLDIGLADVVPTLYHYLGIPVPEDLDGRVVSELFEEEFMQPVRYGPPIDGTGREGDGDESEDAKQAVKERLEDLGYL